VYGTPTIGLVIAFDSVVKRYGPVKAVDEVTIDVGPGRVTGLLGPNGAGKTTLLRMLLGLAAPSDGRATIGGQPYGALRWPTATVGAHLDVRGAHPGRRARSHLRAVAHAAGIGPRRVDEVLEEVGLEGAAGRRVGTFSLGMAQRLGIATALLGDPPVLVLDEPVNGLDPDGVRWLRDLLRRRARAGATVLLSSHLMSETQLTADHVVVVARGRLLADAPMARMTALERVEVGCADPGGTRRLATWLDRAGHRHRWTGASLEVDGIPAHAVGDAASALGIGLHLLRPVVGDLESAYRCLVDGATASDPSAVSGG
jgi:ABC-2 type transport system ATP-binding protein